MKEGEEGSRGRGAAGREEREAVEVGIGGDLARGGGEGEVVERLRLREAEGEEGA